MGTRIEDAEGNLLWSPSSLEGSYTVNKVQDIVKILQDLLSEISITFKSDSDMFEGTYTKEQIHTLLESYIPRDELTGIAESVILAYVQALQDKGLLVTTEVTQEIEGSVTDIVKVTNFLARYCFDTGYEDMLGWAPGLSFTPSPTRLDNLTSRVDSVENLIDSVVRDVYEDAQQRTGFKFALASAVDTMQSDISDLQSQVALLKEEAQEKDQEIQNLKTQVSELETQITAFESRISALESSNSSGEDTP